MNDADTHEALKMAYEIQDLKAQNAKLLSLLKECRDAIADLMSMLENKGGVK